MKMIEEIDSIIENLDNDTVCNDDLASAWRIREDIERIGRIVLNALSTCECRDICHCESGRISALRQIAGMLREEEETS